MVATTAGTRSRTPGRQVPHELRRLDLGARDQKTADCLALRMGLTPGVG